MSDQLSIRTIFCERYILLTNQEGIKYEQNQLDRRKAILELRTEFIKIKWAIILATYKVQQHLLMLKRPQQGAIKPQKGKTKTCELSMMIKDVREQLTIGKIQRSS